MPTLSWEITGKVFVFEGPDGAGKTTQIESVAHRLNQMGYLARICRSPGSTELGEYLRVFLKQVRQEPIHKRSEMYLQFANHHQLFHQAIFTHRDDPDYSRMIFLIDRLDLSTLVYQSLDENDIIQRNSIPRQVQWMFYQFIGSVPTYIILSADESILQQRLRHKKQQPDRYETNSEQEKRRIIEAYQDIIEKDQDRPTHHFVNDQDVDTIADQITEVIDETYQVTFQLEKDEQL